MRLALSLGVGQPVGGSASSRPVLTLVRAPVIIEVAAEPGHYRLSPAEVAEAGAVQASVQWLRDGQPVSGATGQDYVSLASEAGYELGAMVIITLAGHVSLTAYSNTVLLERVDATWQFDNGFINAVPGAPPLPPVVSGVFITV